MTNIQACEFPLAAGLSNPQPAIPLHLTDESIFLLGHFRRELDMYTRMTLGQLRHWCCKYINSDQACALYSPDHGSGLAEIRISKERTYTAFCNQLQLYHNAGVEDPLPRCIQLMSNKFTAAFLWDKRQHGAFEWLQWANAKLSHEVHAAQVNQAANNYATLFGGVNPGVVPVQFNTGMNTAPPQQRGGNTAKRPQTSNLTGDLANLQPGPTNPSGMQGRQISGYSVRFEPQNQISSGTLQNPNWPENKPADMACASSAQPVFGDQGSAHRTLDSPPQDFHFAPYYGAVQQVMPSSSSQLPRAHSYTSSSIGQGTNTLAIEPPQPYFANMGSYNHATGSPYSTIPFCQPTSSQNQASITAPLAVPTTHVGGMVHGPNARPIIQQYRSNAPGQRRAGQTPLKPESPLQTTFAQTTLSGSQNNGMEPMPYEPDTQRRIGKGKRRMSATGPVQPSKKPRTTPLPFGRYSATAVASSSMQCDAALKWTDQSATGQHQEPGPQVLGKKHDGPELHQGGDHSISTGDPTSLDVVATREGPDKAFNLPSASAVELNIQSNTDGHYPEIIDLTLTPDDPDEIMTSHSTGPTPSDAEEIVDGGMYTEEELFGSEPPTPAAGTDAQGGHMGDGTGNGTLYTEEELFGSEPPTPAAGTDAQGGRLGDVPSQEDVQQSSNQASSGNTEETGMTVTEEPEVGATSPEPREEIQVKTVPDGDMEFRLRWLLEH